MSDPSVSSERFGAAVAQALGTGPGRSTLAVQRAEVLELLQAGGRRPSALHKYVPRVALACATLALGLALWLGFRKPMLEARVGEETLAERRELFAERAPKLLSFSDGSEVTLQAAARASLSHISQGRADLELKQGTLVASIQKRTGVTWSVAAGPYVVRVVGTRFSVDWTPTSKTLRVDVTEGRVRVSGGDLPTGGVALDGGSHLERRFESSEPRRAVAPTANEPGVIEREPSSAQPEATTQHLPVPAGRNEPPSSAGSAASAAPTFLALSARGKYRDALEEAERQGFAQLVATLPENDLVTLANAARFSGNSERAKEALLKLRQRFRGRPGAELGALYLARVAEDLDKRPREAAQWLRVFLQESPAGDLAAGARANLMATLQTVGDGEGARGVAEDYLRYHPNGPHIQKARALLAQAQPRE